MVRDTARLKLRAGIDLGGTKMQAIVVDAKHAVLGQARQPTPTSGGPKAVVAALAESVRGACEDAGIEPGRALAGIGLGSPGAIDDTAGTVANAMNLPEWPEQPVPVAARLAEALGVEVPSGWATTSTSPPVRSSSSAPRRSTTRCWASSGGRASAAA